MRAAAICAVAFLSIALEPSAQAFQENAWLKERKANVLFADHTFSGEFRNLRHGDGAWDHYEHEKILRPGTLTSLIVRYDSICILFAGQKFSGPFLVLGPGHCPNLDAFGWNDRAQSVRFVPLSKAKEELAKLGLKGEAANYITQGSEQKPGAGVRGGPARAPASVADANIAASAAADRMKVVCFDGGVKGMWGPGCKEAKQAYEKAERAVKEAGSKEKADTGSKDSSGKTPNGRHGGEGGRGI